MTHENLICMVAGAVLVLAIAILNLVVRDRTANRARRQREERTRQADIEDRRRFVDRIAVVWHVICPHAWEPADWILDTDTPIAWRCNICHIQTDQDPTKKKTKTTTENRK